MSSLSDWKVSPAVQPKPEKYGFDLDRALSAVVGLRAIVPGDAFTAEVLGTERAGNGVLIREDGVVLTIGYLITEAESVWIRLVDGRPVQGHALAYDHETGLGLVQALGHIDLPPLRLGDAAAAQIGDAVVVGGVGGRQRSVAATISAKQEFAGSWEYVLDEALFTAPAHPNWGGTALIGSAGELIGIGSLQLQQQRATGEMEHLNMMVPTDLLKPIFDDLMKFGRPNRPARPWLGIYATEIDRKIVIMRVATGGPGQRAELRPGDVILAVAGTEVNDLADLFRRIWSLGHAGVEVRLLVYRDGSAFEAKLESIERSRLFKTPSLH
jgi:S1-C subfamily serine protease